MIAAGFYVVQAAGPAEFIRSSKNETPGVKVPFVVEGEPIDWTGWLTEKAEVRTAESLALMGYDGADESSVMRQSVQLVVEHETYDVEGETRTAPKIKWVNDPNRARGMGEPMDAAGKAEAKQRLRGLVLAQKQKQGALPGATMPFDKPRGAGHPAPPAGKPKF
jgi:hypothetical protein